MRGLGSPQGYSLSPAVVIKYLIKMRRHMKHNSEQEVGLFYFFNLFIPFYSV